MCNNVTLGLDFCFEAAYHDNQPLFIGCYNLTLAMVLQFPPTIQKHTGKAN